MSTNPNPAYARLTLLMAALAISVPGLRAADTDAYHSVNTFIGTGDDGNTFPGATLPLGMMQWGPDTRNDGWYRYADHTMRGLSLTHISGAGCPIYADVPILPWIGNPDANPNETTLAFSHDHERTQPGYYAVDFDNGIKTELTVTTRAGIGHFFFPNGSAPTLLFKAGDSAMAHDKARTADSSTVEVRGNDTLVGTVHSGGFCFVPGNYTVYFVARFAQPFSTYGTWKVNVNPDSRTVAGHLAGAYVSFADAKTPVAVKVGISFVSIDNAIANLDAEIPGWDFDAVHVAAKTTWTQRLESIDVQGGAADDRVKVYTGLYHMLLSPNVFNDVNGDYIGFDGKVRRLPAGEEQYANFSDWDIYRSLVQLQAWLMPRQVSQMMQSLVRDAEQSGWLPKWPVANDVSYVMGGDSPSILLADAWAFGAHSFDTATALKYMLKGATQLGQGPHGGSERPWLKDYLAKGYVPVARHGQEIGASVTLEYASSDFATSQFAKALGDQADSAALLRSSQKWKNLFDPESGFIRPRDTTGKFVEGWDPDRLLPKPQDRNPTEQIGFEEGNTWHYTFMIPHNYRGLLDAMGGEEKALPKLDKFFQRLAGLGAANFTVENEPDFCAPYVYMWTSYPWKSQAVIDRIRRETFTTKPDGLPGNDDLGATSGVYVWNALGMYPVIPGVGGVVLGTPLFSRATIHLGNGSTLDIRGSGSGIYVQSVNLNGKAQDSSWLPLESLTPGVNRLDFALADQHSSWAAQAVSHPPSFDAPDFYLKHGDRVVFYGDSITDQRLYTTIAEAYVVTRYPNLDATFIHSGWGGDRVTGGGGGPVDLRLNRDVIAYKPTVMTVMLGMNDGNYAPEKDSVDRDFFDGFRHIIESVRSALPDIRITAIRPSPYDDVTRAPNFTAGYNDVMVSFGKWIANYAQQANLNVADLNTPVVSVIQKANELDAQEARKIVQDRIHPALAGHLIMAEQLLKSWNARSVVAAVTIDAAAGAPHVELSDHASITDLSFTKGLQWTELDDALPLPFVEWQEAWGTGPVALVIRSSDVGEALNNEPLKVTGLKDGVYTLTIDDQVIGDFNTDRLAEGINLGLLRTPMEKQAGKVWDLTLAHCNIHQDRWRNVQVPLADYNLPEAQPTMEAMDALERAVIAKQHQAAQPQPHHFSLVPVS